MTPEQKLISRLLAMFGEPKSLDPDQFVKDFAKAIEGYSPELLEAAGDAVIRKCTFWPKPAEVIAEAVRIGGLKSGMFKPFTAAEDPPPLTDEQKARVRAIKQLAIEACNRVQDPPLALPPPPKVDRDTFEAMRAGSANPIHRKNIVKR